MVPPAGPLRFQNLSANAKEALGSARFVEIRNTGNPLRYVDCLPGLRRGFPAALFRLRREILARYGIALRREVSGCRQARSGPAGPEKNYRKKVPKNYSAQVSAEPEGKDCCFG